MDPCTFLARRTLHKRRDGWYKDRKTRTPATPFVDVASAAQAISETRHGAQDLYARAYRWTVRLLALSSVFFCCPQLAEAYSSRPALHR